METVDREALKEINKQFFALRELRSKLADQDGYKLCFNCQNVLPIDEFGDNNKKYCRPNQKGTNYWCNSCLSERSSDSED
tara:strand:+ start:291 stop:530 length:240 start_codon:yes stop_codon:yes gene_type:complete